MVAPPPKSESSGQTNAARNRRPVGVLLIYLAQALLLTWAGWENRHRLNTDAIAYLRLAGYYAAGQADLMVSGYWGPLLSWLIAALLKLGVPSLAAARVVMGVSALVFTAGALALLRSLALPRGMVLVAAGIAAAMSVPWSVAYISPDLLLAGLVCLALGWMTAPGWLSSPRTACLAGGLWGLAYLAKAVALPLAFGAGLALAGFHFLPAPAQRRQVVWRLGLSWLALLLVAGPWIAVLSVKYGRLTFSTSARIAHAVVGPPDRERYHPTMRSFHRPEAGRLTSWEDPSGMPYHYWSPLASAANRRHQLALSRGNFLTITTLLAGFDLAHLGCAAILGGTLLLAIRRTKAIVEERWTWTVPPVLGLAVTYLPVYVQAVDERYFYAAYPLLLGALGGALASLAKHLSPGGTALATSPRPGTVAAGLPGTGGGENRVPGRASPTRADEAGLRSLLALLVRGAWIVALISWAVPAALGPLVACQGLPDSAGVLARELAERLQRAGLRGPIAGSGMIAGERVGLYLAFFLDEPWYGDMVTPSAEDFRTSGAKLLVLNRRHPVTAGLDLSPGFRSLDDRLFDSPADATNAPVKLYQLLPPRL